MLSLAEDRSPSGLGIQKKAKESFLPPAPPSSLLSSGNTDFPFEYTIFGLCDVPLQKVYLLSLWPDVGRFE